MAEMLPGQRHLFDIDDEICYLNCAYMSPLAKPVTAAIQQALKPKTQPWNFLASDFFTVVEEFRAAAANLIGVSDHDLAIIPSTSYGVATAAKNLPLSAGQNIVVLADQFPSNIYAWRAKAEAAGANMKSAKRASDGGWSEAVLDAINEDTAIVAIPHCHWADGGKLDLISIGQKARRYGAALVLDATQSLGAMPMDIAAARPDFVIASCYKWLMGPYGLSIMYVDPKWQGGDPIEYSWINRAGSENFAGLVNYTDDFQPGARRFDMGEKSNPPLLAGGTAAVSLLAQWGIENIAKTLNEKNLVISKAAKNIGLQPILDAHRADHFLSIELPDGIPANLLNRMMAEKIYVSVRGSSLRVTPHLYNNDQDVDRLIQFLSSV